MTVGDIVAEGWAVHADIAPRKDRLKRTQELLDRGHSEPEIAAIMGGNTLRVLRAVLPE